MAYVGKVTIDKTVDVTKSMTICFTLREENFKLKEVMVTAQLTQAGGATSSVIGRNAMDHMQAASLSDVMSLLPGGLASEPSLASVKNVTIRDNGFASSMNSLGTAVIRDGAPMSNNANLSSLSPTNNGTSTTNGVVHRPPQELIYVRFRLIISSRLKSFAVFHPWSMAI